MGAVLAGGASARMGTDKAFIEIEGEPMVARAVGALRSAGAAPVLVVGGDRSRISALGLDHMLDRHPGQGPLGGVITALGALDPPGGSGPDAVVTLPCDVKAPDPTAVRLVIDRLATDRSEAGPSFADLVVPLGGGVPQWLHAGWHRSCLPRLSEAFGAGVRALNEVAGQLRTVAFEVPGMGWFADADRPGDLPPTTLGGVHRRDKRESSMQDTDIPEIDIDELERRRAAGAAVFDVREPDEHDEVRIPGAVLVPLASVPEAVEDFRAAAAGQAVYVVCGSGGRSGQAVGFLRSLGVDAVNVAGGTKAWHQSGRPVEAGPAPA